jgi:hypothetical protein
MEGDFALQKCRTTFFQKPAEKKIKNAQKKVCTFLRKLGKIGSNNPLQKSRAKFQSILPKKNFKSAQKKCALFFI